MTHWFYYLLAVTVKSIVFISLLIGFSFLLTEFCRWLTRFRPCRLRSCRFVLNPVARLIKNLTKDNNQFNPAGHLFHFIAPAASAVFALIALAAIPFGERYIILSDLHPGLARFPLFSVIDLDLGLVFVIVAFLFSVFIFFWTTWLDRSDLTAYLSGLSAVNILFIPLSFVFVLLTPVVLTGSFYLPDFVKFQAAHGSLFLYQPLGSVLFCWLIFVLIRRGKLDFSQQRLVQGGGLGRGYDALRSGFLQLAGALQLLLVVSLFVMLFLGAGRPFFHNIALWMFFRELPVFGFFWPLFWFVLKVLAVVAFFTVLEITFPRPNLEQILYLNQIVIFPLAVVNLFSTAVLKTVFSDNILFYLGWQWGLMIIVFIVVETKFFKSVPPAVHHQNPAAEK